MSQHRSVSAVICTTGRINTLMDAVQSLARQSEPPKELIIVDQSKGEDVEHFCQSADCPFPVRRVRVEFRSLARGRNVAIDHACSSMAWVLYLDDDVVLSRHYLKELLDGAHNHPTAKVVFGAIDGLWRSPTVFNLFARLTGLPYHGPGAGYRVLKSYKNTMDTDVKADMRADWATGCGFMVNRSVFDTIHFDDKLTTYCLNEDMDFSYRVSKAYPDSVWCIARARLQHLEAPANRMHQNRLALMRTLYSVYYFHKNRNLGISTPAFVLSEVAYTIAILGASLIRFSGNPYPFRAHLSSFGYAWKYRHDLAKGDLTRVNALFS